AHPNVPRESNRRRDHRPRISQSCYWETSSPSPWPFFPGLLLSSSRRFLLPPPANRSTYPTAHGSAPVRISFLAAGAVSLSFLSSSPTAASSTSSSVLPPS
ncbi:unnamed protein product, partial [Ectocarpus sp. 12 AP-2014]